MSKQQPALLSEEVEHLKGSKKKKRMVEKTITDDFDIGGKTSIANILRQFTNKGNAQNEGTKSPSKGKRRKTTANTLDVPTISSQELSADDNNNNNNDDQATPSATQKKKRRTKKKDDVVDIIRNNPNIDYAAQDSMISKNLKEKSIKLGSNNNNNSKDLDENMISIFDSLVGEKLNKNAVKVRNSKSLKSPIDNVNMLDSDLSNMGDFFLDKEDENGENDATLKPMRDFFHAFYSDKNKTDDEIKNDIFDTISHMISDKLAYPASDSDDSVQQISSNNNNNKKPLIMDSNNTASSVSQIVKNKSETTSPKKNGNKKAQNESKKNDAKKTTATTSSEGNGDSKQADDFEQELLNFFSYEADDKEEDKEFGKDSILYSFFNALLEEESNRDAIYRDYARTFLTNVSPPSFNKDATGKNTASADSEELYESLERVTQSYCARFLREARGMDYFERNCRRGRLCIVNIMGAIFPDSAHVNSSDDGFICREFLLPSQEEKCANGILPEQVQLCLVDNRLITYFHYIKNLKNNTTPKELLQNHCYKIDDIDGYAKEHCIFPMPGENKKKWTGIVDTFVKFSPNNYIYNVMDDPSGRKNVTLKCLVEQNLNF